MREAAVVRKLDRLALLVGQLAQGVLDSLALEAKPMQEAQEWIDRYREFWEGNLDQFEKYLDKLQKKETKHDT